MANLAVKMRDLDLLAVVLNYLESREIVLLHCPALLVDPSQPLNMLPLLNKLIRVEHLYPEVLHFVHPVFYIQIEVFGEFLGLIGVPLYLAQALGHIFICLGVAFLEILPVAGINFVGSQVSHQLQLIRLHLRYGALDLLQGFFVKCV